MTHRVRQRLYHTADKSRLVTESSPEAAFLAFPAGAEMSDEEAERFGVAAFEKSLRPRDKMQRPVNKGATTKEST